MLLINKREIKRGINITVHAKSIIVYCLYMTLGPKFFSCNKMAITQRTKHLIKRKALIFEALVETHLPSYPKRDLKQNPKTMTLVSQVKLKDNSIAYLPGAYYFRGDYSRPANY